MQPLFLLSRGAHVFLGSITRFRGHQLALISLLTSLLAWPLQAQTIRYVKPDGLFPPFSNPATATSWNSATGDLQGAIDASQAGDEVWVAAGTYKPTSITTNRSASFSMKNGVKIYGGYVLVRGGGSYARGPLNPSGSILSGDIDNNGTLANNSYHVISNPSGLTTTAVLDGFVITGGNANGIPFPNNVGGGVYNNGGNGTGLVCSPSFRNCTFQANTAFSGGAMFNDGNFSGSSSPQLTNCSFLANITTGNGGAMYNGGSDSGTSSPQLTNCSFQSNTASIGGGAMCNDGANGGSSSPQLTNCSFLGNTATNVGGALFNIGNFSGSSSPQLTNCSFLANITTGNGGLIYNDVANGGSSSTQLINCIMFGNGGNNTFFNSRTSASVVVTYSLFEPSVVTVTGVVVSGPGNLTTAVSPFASTTSTQLNAGSLAINAGDPATTTATVGNTDLAGNPRIVSGRVDMGAFEFQGSPCQPVAITSQTVYKSVCVGITISSVPVIATGSVTGYQWYKDGVAISGQTSATLTLPATTTASAGNYSIVVTGVCNSVTATMLNLSVDVLLSFTSQPAPVITACLGTTVTVGVSYTGTTGGGIQWYKLGQAGYFPLDGQTSATLSLPNVTTANAGTYYVQVKAGECNRNGTVSQPTISASFSLIVNTAPARLYVKAFATGANTGLNWTDAFPDLQSALNYGCAGNLTEIWVAAGTYKPTSTTDRTRSFAMRNGVAIYGGFVGTETSLSQRNWATNPTILSGDIGVTANTTDNSYHVIANRALTATAILDGFTIMGGNASGASPFNNGGGMYNYSIGSRTLPGDATCSPQIRNCQFIYNTASNGGAIYNEAQTGQGDGTTNPQFINCLFQDNIATSGGAIYTTTGLGSICNPQLLNCSFQNNTAGSGGALFNFRGSVAGSVNVQLTNCVFWGNGAGNTILNYFGQGVVTATYSLFEASVTGYTSGPGNLTTTASPFVSSGNAQLAVGSLAINAGDPATTAATVGTTDLAGNPRFYNNGRIDMGAFEFQAVTTGPIVTVKDGQWTDPTVWSVNRVPAAGDDVTVQHTVVIPVNSTATIRRLTYGIGGKIQYGGTPAQLRLGF